MTPTGRVVALEIPASPQGRWISTNGIPYGRQGSSLVTLSDDKRDQILRQTGFDWTAQIVPNATLDDLDPDAILLARRGYFTRHAKRFSETDIAAWTDREFLSKAKLLTQGKISRATLLLLGKAESIHLLNPHPAEMIWRLEGDERANEAFGPPFLLNTTKLYQKIRNFTIKILPENQLIPYEVLKYDERVILEALHNCIAHQDYSKRGLIHVIEREDRLIFENLGSFFSVLLLNLLLVKKPSNNIGIHFLPMPCEKSKWLIGKRMGFMICLKTNEKDFSPYQTTISILMRPG
jgi:ATP-dependent DNA helicase RecG